MHRYKEFSLKFYTVLMSFADDLQAVSVDEALIDVTNAVQSRTEVLEMELGDGHGKDPAKEVAESIRDAIRESTNCEGECICSYKYHVGSHRPFSEHWYST